MQSLATCNMLCGNMQLWPHPTGHVSISTTGIPVRAELFQLRVVKAPSPSVHDHLQEAFNLFRENFINLEKNMHGFAEWRAVGLHVSVNGSLDPRLSLDTDESYELVIEPRYGPNGPLEIRIIAKSFCGARHGLETLSQLIWLDPYFSSLFIVESATVVDEPRFKYRGIMLDTARNFFPVNDILRTMDAMAASKLNTFHWRVSDSQSFSLKLKSVSQLACFGAYGPGASYSLDDVEIIVQYARLRGIRVIIEVDTPAHVGNAWKWYKPKNIGDNIVLCLNEELWDQFCNAPPCGQLNPRNSDVYEYLQQIYAEIIALTDVDDVFHIGGDDISERCWTEHFKDIDPAVLWLEFTKNVLNRLEIANGKLPNTTIIWSSTFSHDIKTTLKDYEESLALQVRSSQWVNKYVRGMRTIISHEEPWNFNSGMGEWDDETSKIPYNSWQQVYEHRPWAHGVDVPPVIGGEAIVWSTMLSSGGLDSRIWPRASALAERLWSDIPQGATRLVYIRLDIHRSRLLARGIHAAPLWSMWCSQNPYTCG